MFDYLVVGAGFAGSVLAERLAGGSGKKVLVVDKRPHIGGNAYDQYDELPSYLAGWDVALLPFARNDATRFISPTKTPEYLAAGKPVVSTSIRDVVRPYGIQGLVRIADDPDEFVAAVEAALAEDSAERLRQVDAFLTQTSWDGTWTRMYRLVSAAMTAEDIGTPGDSLPAAAPGVA